MCFSFNSYGYPQDLMKTSDITGFQRHCLKEGYPFVSYRMPGEYMPVTIFGKPRALSPGSMPPAEKGFVFSPFDSMNPSLWFKAEMIIKGTEVEEGYFAVPETETLKPDDSLIKSPLLPKETTQENYFQSMDSIFRSLRSGDIQKVVLSRVIRISLDIAQELPLLFKNLLASYQSAFVYLLYSPDSGAWLGATPELLLSTIGQKVSTMALAGTRKTGTETEWGQKEIDEQQWVAKYIRQKLEESGCSGIEQTRAYTVKAGNVEHLRTDFLALTPGTDFTSLLSKLHPTPAVCGWPADKAAKIISETEGYNRTFYTGYLGPVNLEQKTSLFVNLRCLQAIDNEAAIYAGGGITINSNPSKEWEETAIKSRTLLAEIEKIRNLAE